MAVAQPAKAPLAHRHHHNRRYQSVSKRAKHLRTLGYFDLVPVFGQKYFPHLPDRFTCLPQDGMHALFSSGIANSEAAELLYLHIAVYKDFTVAELNDRMGSPSTRTFQTACASPISTTRSRPAARAVSQLTELTCASQARRRCTSSWPRSRCSSRS